MKLEVKEVPRSEEDMLIEHMGTFALSKLQTKIIHELISNVVD